MPAPGSHRDDHIDAVAYALTDSTVERSYDVQQLDRLTAAEALPGTKVALQVRFFEHADYLEVRGGITGQLLLTCQRCLQGVAIAVDESLVLRVVTAEADMPAESEYDYVVADPARLDLRWLTEEQALLAMPLVPMHEPDRCPQIVANANEGSEQGIAQTPFANLRDILKKG
jgi:uncharacterized protein